MQFQIHRDVKTNRVQIIGFKASVFADEFVLNRLADAILEGHDIIITGQGEPTIIQFNSTLEGPDYCEN